MVNRALWIVAAGMAAATVLAFTGSPISRAAGTPAPHNAKKALRILHADVMKLARDYKHKRYRAVCSDLTTKELQQFGGVSTCKNKLALVHLLVPVKKFTITGAKLAKRNTQGAVSLYLNGNKKHLVHAVAKWEGGRYRVDHMSGWKPKT